MGRRATDTREGGPGRHRRAVTVGSLLAGGAAIVVTALLTDATGWLVDTFDRLTSSDTPQVSLSDNIGQVSWLLPPGTESPFANPENCGQDWPALGRQVRGAIPAHNEWRVDITGPARDSILIHSLTPKIVSEEPIPPGSTLYSCAIGGGVSERTAVLNLPTPGATEYYSSDNQDLRGLAYQLQPGEHGSFFLWQKDHQAAQGIYRFEVLMEYSGRSGTHQVNLNELIGVEPFTGVETCGLLMSFGGEETFPGPACP